MTQSLLIGGAVVWLLALAWVVQDAVASFPRSTVLWWAALALLLGPFAIPFYLSERMARRAELNKLGHGKAAFPVPEGRRPFRAGGQRSFEPVALPGSGVFVSVLDGVDAGQRVEIPAQGALIVRRGTSAERAHAGVLVLHDNAATRHEHCRLRLEHGRVILEDRSRWGTLIDGTRVHGKSVEVSPGSIIQIGKTSIVLSQAGA